MNNNPFEPVTAEPSVGLPLADDAADDFTAGDNTKSANSFDSPTSDFDSPTNNFDSPAKTPLSIDGISPNYDYDNTEKASDVTLVGSRLDDNRSTTAGDDILTDDHAGDFLNGLGTDEVTNDSPKPEITAEPAKDDLPVPAPTVPDKPEKPVKNKAEKPVKHITISLLTIIFFVLAIAGIAGAVWFFMQNNKNVDALNEANGQVQELKDELSAYGTTESTSGGQYDGLTEKIESLAKTNEENLKTIDEQKKKVDELTKNNADLTTQLAEQTKKAADISGIVTKLDTVLSNCHTSTGQSCSVSVP